MALLINPPKQPPQYRWDAERAAYVIIAPERAYRSFDSDQVPISTPSANCAFCPGHEHLTTEELFAVRLRKTEAGEEAFATEQGTGSDWRVRVFANKFPAVNNVIVANSPSMSVDILPGDPSGFFTNNGTVFKPVPGAGIHEVIIDSRMHSSQMVDADDLQVHDWLYTCEQRFWNCERVDPSLVPILFKNQGRASGASQEHPHCQLLASPFIPPILAIEFQCSTAFFHETGQVLLTELLARELVQRTRIVEATDHFVAYCPFASRFPFELRIAPRRPQSSLLDQFDWPTKREGVADRSAGTDALPKVRPTDPVRLELAGLYRRSIIRLESCLRGIGYNVNIHSAPRLLPAEMRRPHGYGGIDLHDGYCWHIEVTPRWLGIAGFEIGSGTWINPCPPEWSAEQLRAAL